MLVVRRTPGFCSLAQSGWHCDAAVGSTDFLLEPLPGTDSVSMPYRIAIVIPWLHKYTTWRGLSFTWAIAASPNPIIDPLQLQSGRPGLILLTNWFGYVLGRVTASGSLVWWEVGLFSWRIGHKRNDSSLKVLPIITNYDNRPRMRRNDNKGR